MFKRNEGTLDRLARLAVGIILLPAGLFWLGALQGNVVGLVAAVVGLIGLVTSLTGFCLAYVPFGVSTVEAKEKPGVAS